MRRAESASAGDADQNSGAAEKGEEEGKEGRGRSRPADRRSRGRAPYVRLSLPPPSFLPLVAAAAVEEIRARALWPFVRSKLGFLCGPLLAPPCRCHLPPLPSPPRRRPRHVFTFGPSDKPFMRSRGVDTLCRVAELIPKRSENFTNVCTGIANF